jgi:hypothetical protein
MSEPHELFSPGWFDRLEAVLRDIPAGDQPEDRVRIGQVVMDAPAGEVAYTVSLGGGAPAELDRAGTDRAAVTLVESYETACALASGSRPDELLAAGRVKVRGDVNALIRAQKGLAAIAEALAGTGGEPGG